MFSFAFKTLVSDRGKLLTGLAGVIFSVVLVNVQGGLYFGLMKKASLLVDHCDADLWVGHKHVENVDIAREIPEIWGNRIRSITGCDAVKPYIVGKGTAALSSGLMEDVWIIGSDPETMLGTAWDFAEGSVDELKRPNGVSFDDVDAPKLGHPHVGDWMEVNGERAQIVARTNGVTGFITMPYLFTSFETARRMSHITPGTCSFLLIKLLPGANRDQVQAAIRQRVPDASVFTPDEFAKISQDYWMKRTGIGISFGASTLLGLFVGLMMVGQSLYALALDHIEDYATLKALGAAESKLCSVIISQSLLMATVGTTIGVGIVIAIRELWHSPMAPVLIPTSLLSGAVVLVFGICLAASLLPYFRIRRVDPAIVLMG